MAPISLCTFKDCHDVQHLMLCAMRFRNKTMITVPLISESLLLLPVASGMISYPQIAT